jgi:hypothetical protein
MQPAAAVRIGGAPLDNRHAKRHRNVAAGAPTCQTKSSTISS